MTSLRTCFSLFYIYLGDGLYLNNGLYHHFISHGNFIRSLNSYQVSKGE